MVYEFSIIRVMKIGKEIRTDRDGLNFGIISYDSYITSHGFYVQETLLHMAFN